MKIKYLAVIAVLITAIFGFTFSVSAQQVSDCTTGTVNQQITCLTNLVAQITAQIQTLQSQQGTTNPPVTAWCYNFNKNLGTIDSGTDAVVALHTALQKQGFSYASDGDNTYSDGTISAVIQFQAKYGISQTGYVGVITRAKLNVLYKCSVSATPSITVTSPNGGETWQTGSTHNLTWITTGEELRNVRVDLYKAGTLLQNIYTSASNDGNQSWTLPATLAAGNDYKIRVSKYLNADIYDESNANFSIVVLTTTAMVASLDSSSPMAQNIVINQTTWLAKFKFVNSSGNNETISRLVFHKIGTAPDSVLALTKLYSSNYGQVISGNPTSVSSGSVIFSGLSILIPANSSVVISTDITPMEGPGGFAGMTVGLAMDSNTDIVASDAVSQFNVSGLFPINGYLMTLINSSPQSSVTVTSPNGGETWQTGSTHNLTWITTGEELRNVRVDLYKAGTLLQNIYTSASNDGNQSWTLPATLAAGNDYKIRVSKYLNADIYDESNANFSIVVLTLTPTITVTSPNGGEYYIPGQTVNVTWSSVNMPSSSVVNVIRLREISSGQEYNLATDVLNDGNESVVFPTFNGVNPAYPYTFVLEIKTYINDQLAMDASDSYIKIYNLPTSATPTVTVTSPNGGETWQTGTTHAITWTTTLTEEFNSVRVDLYKAGSLLRNIWTYSTNDGNQNWTVPTDLAVGNDYKIRVSKYLNADIYDESNANFSIIAPTVAVVNGACGSVSGVATATAPTTNLCLTGTASIVSGTGPWSWSCVGLNAGTTASCSASIASTQPSIAIAIAINVTSPNGGETWAQGSTHNLTWTTTGEELRNVRVDLYKAGSPLRNIFISASNDGNQNWTFPTDLAVGTDYKIRVSKYLDATIYDESNANFSIVAPTVGSIGSEDQLASISAALAKILAEIQAMLNK